MRPNRSFLPLFSPQQTYEQSGMFPLQNSGKELQNSPLLRTRRPVGLGHTCGDTATDSGLIRDRFGTHSGGMYNNEESHIWNSASGRLSGRNDSKAAVLALAKASEPALGWHHTPANRALQNAWGTGIRRGLTTTYIRNPKSKIQHLRSERPHKQPGVHHEPLPAHIVGYAKELVVGVDCPRGCRHSNVAYPRPDTEPAQD